MTITSIFDMTNNMMPIVKRVTEVMAQTIVSNGLMSAKNLGLTVGRGLANVKKSLS